MVLRWNSLLTLYWHSQWFLTLSVLHPYRTFLKGSHVKKFRLLDRQYAWLRYYDAPISLDLWYAMHQFAWCSDVAIIDMVDVIMLQSLISLDLPYTLSDISNLWYSFLKLQSLNFSIPYLLMQDSIVGLPHIIGKLVQRNFQLKGFDLGFESFFYLENDFKLVYSFTLWMDKSTFCSKWKHYECQITLKFLNIIKIINNEHE